jgi:hypothetical protein
MPKMDERVGAELVLEGKTSTVHLIGDKYEGYVPRRILKYCLEKGL